MAEFRYQDDVRYLVPDSDERLFKDVRSIPFAVACLSIGLQVVHILAFWVISFIGGKSPKSEEANVLDVVDTRHLGLSEKLKKHVAYYGGNTIFGFMVARLSGSVTLLQLSQTTLRKCHANALKECPEAFLTVAFLYSAVLAFISVVSKTWSASTTRHNIIVLLSTFAVYAYRDLWPLGTYTKQPADIAEGKILFVKIGVLAFTAVVIPLFIPRRYVPVDPKNPMPEPNPEQTASIFSLMTYTFLDSVIFLGYKVPHLRFDQLPPLADYDAAKYQTIKAFPHLDVFRGAKHRSLFLRFMRVFRKEYSILALSVFGYSVGSFASPIGIYQILNYLETGGVGASIRPWVWIIWLFMGPMIQSFSFQWYIFVATRTLALTEVLVTQLVFEHSLRIRLKAETSNDFNYQPITTATPSRAESPVGTTASDAASTSAADDSEPTSVSGSTTRETSEASQASTLTVREPSTSSSTSTLKNAGKGKAKVGVLEPPKQGPKKVSDGNLIGKINNLVTTDLNNIVGARDFLLVVLYVPLQISLCMVFLYRLLGWSSFVGFGVMLILLPLPGWVAKKIQQAQAQRMKATDARVQTVSEAINVIRMVKLFGWEHKMSERLQEKREEELRLIWKTKFLNYVSAMMGFILPTLTMLTTYGVYTVIMKQELNASKIFSSMAVFSLLREQIFRLTSQTVTIIQGKVSLDRLDEFLHKTELLDSFLEVSKPSSPVPVPTPAESSSDIGFKNATFSWSLDDEGGYTTPSGRVYKLRIDGELLFKRNAINLVIGPTGSGKTSVLMALLGEMHFIVSSPDSWFNLPRDGGVAYASQESWVQNETIRDNILFGSEYDEERYRKVIKQCALERDLELFDAGDATEVGERGLTLSGGQKARITLARAIYSPAEIILLDDVLAALDVHTSSWIVDECFRGDLVKNRTILLVTHNVALASPVADFIVSIGTDGRVKSRGTEISLALARDPKLASEVKHDKEVTEIGQEDIDTAPKGHADGKLVVAEEIVEGHVTWKSFKLILASLAGDHPIAFFTVVMAALLLNEWTFTFQVWFLGYWGAQYETHPASEVPVYLYLFAYSAIILLFCISFSTSNWIFFMYGSIRASRIINNRLIDSMFGSTLRWLDETPVGRIITRCTQDIRAIDSPIPQYLYWVVDCVSGILMKLGAIVLFTPIFLGPGIGVAIIGLWMGNMYLKAQLSVKRETSNARSPMTSHFTAAIHGIVSIRAYGAQDKFKAESLVRINHYTRVSRMSYNLNRWIGVRIDALSASFTVALASYLIYSPSIGASNTGFSLNMAVEFTTLILYLVRIYNEFEVQSNSLERIQGYIDIEHEPKPTEAGKPPAAWPASGDLRVEKLSARYSQSGPKVLHDISFHIASGERVGVVGRTGSGKSSLTLALLRCILTEGEVYFDGVPTSHVNLDALRTSITIIPQTPELLSGTLRGNLDPFDQNDDAMLNAALQAAGLFSLQEDAGETSLSLDTKIASGGGNLSVGQRQIIALARAMVRGSKLLILDEATSAIDYKTDAVIQNTLRSQLGNDVTVITVAHRLQTIMDADKIMVLDSGRIAEFGKPKDLLLKEDGMLRALVDGSGDKEKLYELAGSELTA
ncbi:multidrug resistance-associated ABC transporter [Flammula alnicola]|nr:multidrug resistance-associated ABC transporter [Flammula alnicola]